MLKGQVLTGCVSILSSAEQSGARIEGCELATAFSWRSTLRYGSLRSLLRMLLHLVILP